MKKRRKHQMSAPTQKGRDLSVTIPRDYYNALLYGRKGSNETLFSPGLKTQQAVCEYLQSYMGLLGTVVEVIPE